MCGHFIIMQQDCDVSVSAIVILRTDFLTLFGSGTGIIDTIKGSTETSSLCHRLFLLSVNLI